jgi:hypothetical protein
MNPTVTFVVPCFKLAHFLPECVGSILNQSYGDFEVPSWTTALPTHLAGGAVLNDPRVR